MTAKDVHSEDAAHIAAGPRVRCLCAPNPSYMTQNGTNTYLLGTGKVAVIDPGPAIDAHQSQILAALSPGDSISHIFVTHAHRDHSGLAKQLSAVTGAAVHAFGGADAGRSVAMQRFAHQSGLSRGDGVDLDFQPDVLLADGDFVTGQDWQIEAIHTPGHMGNHLCFSVGRRLFSGDHVMGWSTSVILPPDGDMSDYLASMHKLAQRQWDQFLPGHGSAISNPNQRLDDLIAHRRLREAEILAALASGATDISALTLQVYPGLKADLTPAAAGNILAHLIDLVERNMVCADPQPGFAARYSLS